MFRISLAHLVASIGICLVIGSARGGPPASGEDPAALRTKIDGLLERELTHGWYPRAVDRQRGGFHQTFARDWSPLPDQTRSWSTRRG